MPWAVSGGSPLLQRLDQLLVRRSLVYGKKLSKSSSRLESPGTMSGHYIMKYVLTQGE